MRAARFGLATGLILGALAAAAGLAQTVEGPQGPQGPQGLPVIGAPRLGATSLQPAVTEVARDVHFLDFWVHGLSIVITLFVSALLLAVVLKYRRSVHPEAKRFTHNTPIEIGWTVVPILILIGMGSFSLPVLFKELEVPEPDLTIKATGYQWYWNHEYVANAFSFDSYMLPADELVDNGYAEDLYRLATDAAVVVPAGAVVRVLVTGGDVIHSWTIPAFGVKMDGVPGRLGETWFRAEVEGVYFGQCSELCGKDHAFMPVTVKVVDPETYAAWLDWAIEEYGGTRGEADVALAE